MFEKIVTKGLCNKCGEIVSIRAAKSHIAKCYTREMENSSSEAFLLKVQWPHKNPFYWLYLAVPVNATLQMLDKFLREIWLECCGHLSQFKIGFNSYCCDEDDLPMTIRCKNVLRPGLKFIHEYDFGSTTELLLEVVEFVKTDSPKNIKLIIRNQAPEFKCLHCNEKAVMVCPTHDDYLCESCTADDDEESYLLPLVNSPRTGVCGYVG